MHVLTEIHWSDDTTGGILVITENVMIVIHSREKGTDMYYLRYTSMNLGYTEV